MIRMINASVLIMAAEYVNPIAEGKPNTNNISLGKHINNSDKGQKVNCLLKTPCNAKGRNVFCATPQPLVITHKLSYDTAEDWENDPPGFRNFCNDPEEFPLATPTGKLEFYSESLAKAYPDDKERPPILKWIERSHIHEERLSSHRAKMFPLLVTSIVIHFELVWLYVWQIIVGAVRRANGYGDKAPKWLNEKLILSQFRGEDRHKAMFHKAPDQKRNKKH